MNPLGNPTIQEGTPMGCFHQSPALWVGMFYDFSMIEIVLNRVA